MRRGKPTALGAYIFAGGFSIGVKRAGFDVLAHFEGGEYGVPTARDYFPRLPIHTDPDTWPWEDYAGRVDFLYGNPPCAAWSPLGPRAQQGLDVWKHDARVDCTRVHFNLLELVRPTVWAWESVPQAFTTGRPLVDHLSDRAAKLGYGVDYVLHNARYVGALQARKRFFMVASQIDIDWTCPWLECPTAVDALAAFQLEPGDEDEGLAADCYYRPEFLRMVPPGSSLRGTWDAYVERLRKRMGDKLTEEKRKKLAPRPSFGERRLPVDRPAGAVVDTMIHPTENRYVTLGESAHLGGYPRDFIRTLHGAGVQQKFHQLTRAVLPPVGAWLAGNVRVALEAEVDPEVPQSIAGRRRIVDFTKPPGAILEA